MDFTNMMSTTIIQNESNSEKTNVKNASEQSSTTIDATVTEPKQGKKIQGWINF